MISQTDPPTAVFITDPLTSAGALNEAHKLGLKVPEEFSILGFDDTESRYMVYPTMTAVCQDARASGRAAYELLLGLCRMPRDEWDATEPRCVLGKAWFEVNHTTGRVPKHPSRVLPSGQRIETAVFDFARGCETEPAKISENR
jgi:hypothetical protein